MQGLVRLGWVMALGFSVFNVSADEISVAVASNFSKPLDLIAESFKAASGHELKISAGATGKLYAQIEHGAPFDVLIAADSKMPQKLVDTGQAEAASRFTYAFGKLVLWSSAEAYVDAEGEVLKHGTFKHLAIANAKTAPYGAAALEVLEHLQLMATVKDKLVTGENISQTYDFVSTGNAELGFVALSQVQQDGHIKQGSAWKIPQHLYTPLAQQAVLLKRAKDNAAAKALLEFLKSEAAQTIMRRYGYEFALSTSEAS